MNYYGWRPYVRVAERWRKAYTELAKLTKNGRTFSPVRIKGRTIAKSFWGKSWCANLERYSDFENRLPRGRTYVRNGSVVDLQIVKNKVLAVVSGSDLYTDDQCRAPHAGTMEGRLQGLCGDNRFAGRAAAGPPFKRCHGPGLPGGRWTLSCPQGDQVVMQLSRLG